MPFSFTKRSFCNLLFLVTLISFFRRPHELLSAQFFAEDGAIFFKDAFENTWQHSLLMPFAGYLQLLPRIVAECVLAAAPTAYAPFLFHVVTLLIGSFCLTWFYLPNHRTIVSSDRTRAILVLFFAVSPNQENIMRLAYIQWSLLLWLLFVVLMSSPSTLWSKLGIVCGALLTSSTSPLAVLCLPITLLRAKKDKDARIYFLILTFICIGGFLMHIFLGDHLSRSFEWSVQDILVAFADITCFKVLSVPIWGVTASYYALKLVGWFGLYVLGVSGAVIIIRSFASALRQNYFFSVSAAYLIVCLTLSFLLRPELVISGLTVEGVSAHDRYFFISTILIFCVIGIALQNLSKFRQIRVATLLKMILILHLPTAIRIPRASSEVSWQESNGMILNAQKQKEPSRLLLPITPSGWAIELNVRP